jgi:hypothetical protein
MKQMYIAYVDVCVDDEKIEQIEKLGLEADHGDFSSGIIVRAAEVDIDANILRELIKLGPIEEIAIDAGNEADEIYKNLAEIGCDLSEPDIETDEDYIGLEGWTRQVGFEAMVAEVDIEKIIEVLF